MPVLDALLQRARREAVDLVMIGGETVYREGRFTRVDRASLTRELVDQLSKEPTETDRRNHRLGLRLLEEARRFYAGYVDGRGRDPFYKSNSRI